MISLSHFNNGNRIALNVDLIEKVEETPDTVITLTNGARYLVQESIDEIIEKSAQSRAYVAYLAQHMNDNPSVRRLRLVQGEGGTEPGEESE
jgi:flagellar protein FlbD